VAVCCELGNETSGSLTGGKFLYQLRKFWLLKKDSVHEFIYLFIYLFS
jgi:hypothetical protein